MCVGGGRGGEGLRRCRRRRNVCQGEGPVDESSKQQHTAAVYIILCTYIHTKAYTPRSPTR